MVQYIHEQLFIYCSGICISSSRKIDPDLCNLAKVLIICPIYVKMSDPIRYHKNNMIHRYDVFILKYDYYDLNTLHSSIFWKSRSNLFFPLGMCLCWWTIRVPNGYFCLLLLMRNVKNIFNVWKFLIVWPSAPSHLFLCFGHIEISN